MNRAKLGRAEQRTPADAMGAGAGTRRPRTRAGLALAACAVVAFAFAAPAQGAFQFATQWNADAVDSAVTSAGTVYAAEPDNNRVEVFDSSGALLNTWGTQGSGDGEFQANYGIGVDPAGTVVYVADTYNYRIQKFSATGAYLGT